MSDEADDRRSRELHDLAAALDAVARRVGDAGGRPLDRLTEATLEQLPAARAVSLTVLEGGRFRSEAATDDLARRADALQYEVGRGPCVDAVLESTVNVSADVAADSRWGEWGPRVAAEAGVRSVLAHRLVLADDGRAIACLNVYSDTAHAFDETAVHRGVLLATHGSLLVTAMLARTRADKLAEELRADREVGVAIGVLMYRHRLTGEQAFDLLRLAGQQDNRSLPDVARAVVDDGDTVGLHTPLAGAGPRRQWPPLPEPPA